MKIPVGLTEDRTVAIMYAVSERVGPRFRFGYHSNEDMVQYAVLRSVEVLNEGRFQPKNDDDPVQVEKQLRAFLSTHLHRRLHNFKRDNCKRPGNKSAANEAKFNIMHPLKIDAFADADFLFSYKSRHEQLAENNDLIEYFAKMVDGNLSVGQVELYIDSLSDDDYRELVDECREVVNAAQEEI